MSEENGNTEQEETGQRVYVGFHQLGGLRLVADDVRLTPQEAFVLAGQLSAHATMVIQMTYAAQAQQDEAIASGLIVPPGIR